MIYKNCKFLSSILFLCLEAIILRFSWSKEIYFLMTSEALKVYGLLKAMVAFPLFNDILCSFSSNYIVLLYIYKTRIFINIVYFK